MIASLGPLGPLIVVSSQPFGLKPRSPRVCLGRCFGGGGAVWRGGCGAVGLTPLPEASCSRSWRCTSAMVGGRCPRALIGAAPAGRAAPRLPAWLACRASCWGLSCGRCAAWLHPSAPTTLLGCLQLLLLLLASGATLGPGLAGLAARGWTVEAGLLPVAPTATAIDGSHGLRWVADTAHHLALLGLRVDGLRSPLVVVEPRSWQPRRQPRWCIHVADEATSVYAQCTGTSPSACWLNRR